MSADSFLRPVLISSLLGALAVHADGIEWRVGDGKGHLASAEGVEFENGFVGPKEKSARVLTF